MTSGAGADDEDLKKRNWARGYGEWGDYDAAGDGAYVTPSRPMIWQRDDNRFALTCDNLGRDADQRIIGMVRERALAGAPYAVALAVRAARGMAQSVDMTPRKSTVASMSPEVANAMMEAGLRALGEEIPDLDERPPWDPRPPGNSHTPQTFPRG